MRRKLGPTLLKCYRLVDFQVINIEVQRLCTYMEARLNQAISTKHLLQIPIFNALLNMMASETLEMTDPKADQLIEAVVHVHGGSTASPISLFLPSRGMIKWPILRDWTGFSSLRDANKKTAAILKDYLNEHLATRDSSHDRSVHQEKTVNFHLSLMTFSLNG